VMVGSLAALRGAAALERPLAAFLLQQAEREQAGKAVAAVLRALHDSGSQRAQPAC
jgi:hypothetical protein